jgi:hypothetical protein
MDSSFSMTSLGSVPKARGRANICCSPPDSVPASCLRRSPSRGNREYVTSSRWPSRQRQAFRILE